MDVQKAIDQAKPGDVVELPAEVILIDKPIKIDKGIALSGGRPATNRLRNGPIIRGADIIITSPSGNVTLENLILDRGRIVLDPPIDPATQKPFERMAWIELWHVSVWRAPGNGLDCRETINNLIVQWSQFTDCEHGIYVAPGTCYPRIANTNFNVCRKAALMLDHATDVRVRDCYFEGNLASSDIHLNGGGHSFGNIIDGCTFEDGGAGAAIWLEGCDDVLLTGCTGSQKGGRQLVAENDCRHVEQRGCRMRWPGRIE